jgi:hypothetical protein
MTALLTVLLTLVTPASEIPFDHWLWKQEKLTNKKLEKKVSNGFRLLSFTLCSFLISLVTGQVLHLCAALVAASFILLFDFGLNVSRWSDLPVPYDWRKQQGIEKTMLQKVLFKIRFFKTRFFYHGDEDTKSLYDRAFQRVPPAGELLIKGIIFGVALYFFI